jgi:Holliday junction resolvase RusA-like endonuclease
MSINIEPESFSNYSGTLELPFLPPSTNSLHRVSKTGHVYCTKAYIDFKKKVQSLLIRQLPVGFRTISVPIHLIIDFTVADRRNHDIDNSLKSLFDSFNGILWTDDNLVVEIHASKTIGETPHTRVTYY